jgi:autotransporter-associated beta strand protein
VAVSGGINITNQTLTFNNGSFGTTYGSIFSYGTSTNSWRANVVLNTNCWPVIQSGSGLNFNIVSSISGVGGFNLTGPGELTISANNVSSYQGDTLVNQGTLNLNGYNIVRYGTLLIAGTVRYLSNYCIYGGSGGSVVTLTNAGVLDLNGFIDDVGPINMAGGTINTEGGTLQLFPPLEVYGSPSTINGNFELISDATIGATNDLVINANVTSSGSYTLTKTGPQSLYLNGNNTYTGTNFVAQGWLRADNSTSLGSAANTTVVSSGATLALTGNFAITNASLVLNGPGEPGWGALDSETGGGTNIWVGPITLNADSPIAPFQLGTALRIQGTISGPGGLNVYSASGSGTNASLYLEGSSANTYGGTTTVSNGTLVVAKSLGLAIPGNLVIESNAAVRLAEYGGTALADALVQTGALLDFGPYDTGFDTLRGGGTVNFGINGYIFLGQNNGSSEFDGSFTGAGFASGYTVGKLGTGTFTIGGNSTYTSGYTLAGSGTVIVNGSQPTIPVVVNNGATLGGSGTVGVISASGTIAPGNGGPGILTCSNVVFSSSGKLVVQMDGPNAGSGYDQLRTLLPTAPTLGSASLQLIPVFTMPVAVGQQFDLLQNGSGSALSGIFTGLPEGSSITLGNYKFSLSYLGGSGHDVALTLTSIPGAATGSTVTSGDGSRSIDPNGCNGFYLVVSNQTSSAMNGVSASLSSLSENAIVTQPFATYPNIPAHGTATNVIPFQVSVLPSQVCGTPIVLQLGVNSSLGAFAANYVQSSGEPAAPSEYDVTGNVAIPDVGVVDSTNNVSGFTLTPLTKVTVSLYLTHAYDSDLTNISLVSPDGTTVLLSSANGGSGQNYGSGLTPQSNRTTFDDAAGSSITAGAAPFVGTFRPQSPLSAFAGNATPNGNWHLHIADGFGGSLGTLRGWSLFLYGTGCAAGGGSCALCPDGMTLTNTLTTGSSTMSQRIVRNGIISTCASLKPFPGTLGGVYNYNAFPFYNSSSNSCITVTLASSTSDIQPAVYLNSFDPSNIANNYLGDSGNSTGSGIQSFSVNVPPNTNFVVVVNNIGSVGTYTLNVSGGDCPPILNITPMAAGKVDLSWPTVAGGYNLEATPNLANPAWVGVTNEPYATANHFNVTNSSVNPSNRFYRLSTPVFP